MSVVICSALLVSNILAIRSHSNAAADFLTADVFTGFAAAFVFGAIAAFAAVFTAGLTATFLTGAFAFAAFTAAGFLEAETAAVFAGALAATFLVAGLRGAMAVTP